MFDGLAVSEQFKDKIESAVKSGRLSHALLLEGGDAETRLKAAAEIAKVHIDNQEQSILKLLRNE